MSDLIFYTNPMSRGRIARWMLEEVGAPYDTVIVNWTDKPAALLSANPLGKVPTIVHGAHVVSESAAICAYLADAFPDAGLAPNADERADYYRWMFFAAGPVEAAITDKSLGVTVPGDRRGMVGYGSFDAMVDALEHAVSRHAFIAGDRFTAADVYVGSAVGWGRMFDSLPARPAFENYLTRVNARPAAVRAREIDDGLMAKMTSEANA